MSTLTMRGWGHYEFVMCSNWTANKWHNQDSTSGLLLTQKARSRVTDWGDIHIYGVPEARGVEESVR